MAQQTTLQLNFDRDENKFYLTDSSNVRKDMDQTKPQVWGNLKERQINENIMSMCDAIKDGSPVKLLQTMRMFAVQNSPFYDTKSPIDNGDEAINMGLTGADIIPNYNHQAATGNPSILHTFEKDIWLLALPFLEAQSWHSERKNYLKLEHGGVFDSKIRYTDYCFDATCVGNEAIFSPNCQAGIDARLPKSVHHPNKIITFGSYMDPHSSTPNGTNWPRPIDNKKVIVTEDAMKYIGFRESNIECDAMAQDHSTVGTYDKTPWENVPVNIKMGCAWNWTAKLWFSDVTIDKDRLVNYMQGNATKDDVQKTDGGGWIKKKRLGKSIKVYCY